jgi:hypothetical protein
MFGLRGNAALPLLERLLPFEEVESFKRICGGLGHLRVRTIGEAGNERLGLDRLQIPFVSVATGVSAHGQLHCVKTDGNRCFSEGVA